MAQGSYLSSVLGSMFSRKILLFILFFWGILISDVFMGFPWLYGLFATESPTSVENTRIMEQEILKYMYKLKADLIDSLSSWSWFSPIKVHRDFLPITISPNQFQNMVCATYFLKLELVIRFDSYFALSEHLITWDYFCSMPQKRHEGQTWIVMV